jgi:predicted AlkP superfamily phosphohydrolase/phosphomutase
MADGSLRRPNRRTFLKNTALAAGAACAAGAGVGGYWLGRRSRAPRSAGKKVIVIGIDGMDPRMCEFLMTLKDEHGRPRLPHLARLRERGGFSPLGTSVPPQSPVAWANFINGDGPGSHGIFDFIHRHPHEQCRPFYSAAETLPGEGGWDVGGLRIQVGLPRVVLKRQGVPFWDYLDAAGIPTTFYDLPSNYPPSPSAHGHHRCISGMGTPDMLGTFGTYQHFSEDCPPEGIDHGSGKQSRLTFENDTARATLVGPDNSFLKTPKPVTVDFLVHRDRDADAAVIEIQGHKLLLRAGQWSRWTKIEFSLPWFVPSKNPTGICRFYLQRVRDNFRLYVSPINMDPAAPALQMSEPEDFVSKVAEKVGPFYTTGFQEDYNARKDNVFDDQQFSEQAELVLEERLRLFDYAVDNYDDGLLFFYFSSSDLQSHMFWWEWNPALGPSNHPSREDGAVLDNIERIHALYKRLDQVVGDLMDRYGDRATIFVMSDHGFANFGRQFNLNTWLRENGYLKPDNCTSIMLDADWSATTAYGLGINGLYLNRKGRERDGFVEPGEVEEKLTALQEALEAVVDPATGARVISQVYRADAVYSGGATELAPDLIVGYARGYRSSWATCLGEVEPDIIDDNKLAWSADHCADALEVPGVLFCSRPFRAASPSLVDVAPSILAEFGLPTPASMRGKSIF